MKAISAAVGSQASSPEHATNSKNQRLKRCMTTFEELTMVANTVMDAIAMNELE